MIQLCTPFRKNLEYKQALPAYDKCMGNVTNEKHGPKPHASAVRRNFLWHVIFELIG